MSLLRWAYREAHALQECRGAYNVVAHQLISANHQSLSWLPLTWARYRRYCTHPSHKTYCLHRDPVPLICRVVRPAYPRELDIMAIWNNTAIYTCDVLQQQSLFRLTSIIHFNCVASLSVHYIHKHVFVLMRSCPIQRYAHIMYRVIYIILL
jgi:hypothetical protein